MVDFENLSLTNIKCFKIFVLENLSEGASQFANVRVCYAFWVLIMSYSRETITSDLIRLNMYTGLSLGLNPAQ